MDQATLDEQPISRFGTPDEIARRTLAVICEASFSTGAEFVADGGALVDIRVAPR